MIKNAKYKVNKKNGGNVPVPNDIRVIYVPVSCGVCMECMKKKAREWQIRLSEDIKENKNGKFITLTFNEESLLELKKEFGKDDNTVATKAVRRFLERWRKKFKKSVRHWLVTELGHKGTERIHLHGILYTDEDIKTISDIWSYGYTWEGKYVNERTINYIIKYIHKQDSDHKEYKPIVLTTAGIGRNYTESENFKKNKYKEENTKESYT